MRQPLRARSSQPPHHTRFYNLWICHDVLVVAPQILSTDATTFLTQGDGGGATRDAAATMLGAQDRQYPRQDAKTGPARRQEADPRDVPGGNLERRPRGL